MAEGTEGHGGCGPLHFIAGGPGEKEVEGDEAARSWKLSRLLQAGVDPNSPLSASWGSPLAYHVRNGAINTAEMLLEAGADPWARGPSSFDAPLEAICHGHHPTLTKIATADHLSPCWDRTWVATINEEEFAGGNALHLAAIYGNTQSLELYLNLGLLLDLDCRDNDLRTPMHCAAQFGRSSTVKWLQAHGGNIDARSRNGWAPLHFAANKGHLDTVKTLIKLGAKQQPCNDGCIPLTLAYSTGDSEMIEALQDSAEVLRESTGSIPFPGNLKSLAEGMCTAIKKGDLGACQKLHSLGCPIDVEMDDEERVTPLAVAIYNEDPEIVQWLIKSGATVSTIFPWLYKEKYSTALEVAVARPSMNSLLLELLNKYLDEGVSFLDTDRSPLHAAVEYDNLEGLKTLLKWLRDTYESPDAEALPGQRQHVTA
ncbi:hypothetical protein N0V84_008567 [Fusarium piperis]|uniref:Uncharacterized protein n=1 Tax=Fusarium piperis TaxID=1435070 RepID=A0A9W8W7T8_9HYPO|nr:hypothetical protein N0V84_008567 [Fusarium piperis]